MLAKRAGVSLVALARLESNVPSPRLTTVLKIKAAIEEAGIHVVEGQPSGGFTLHVSGKAVQTAADNAARADVGMRRGNSPEINSL
jgi:transcriptional regulator with XRE-family HTH domain